MLRFLLAAVFAVLLSIVPHVTLAEGEATAKGKTCSESSGGASKASAGGVEKDAKKAVQQMDRTSSDTVTVGADGKVTVSSQCNPKCIGDKLKDAQGKPSAGACPAGRVTMTLPNGTTVSCTKDKEECGKITGALQEAPGVVDAVANGSADAVAKSVAQTLANSETARAALEKGTQSILDSAFASKLPDAVRTAVQEGVGSMLDSIAKGDFEAAATTGKEVKDALNEALRAAGILDAVKDPQSFARLFGPEAAKAMGGAQAAGQLFCGVLGDACPEGMRQFAGGSTFAASGAYDGTQVLRPTAGGTRVDPVALGLRAAELYKKELAGRVFPELGMRNPSPEEFAAGAVALANIESGFKTGANASGQLVRFASTPGGECSYGLYQMCPSGSDSRYGIRSAADIMDPEKSLNGLVQIAKQGQLRNYFGPIQRGMVAPRAAQAYAQLAPYLSGGTAYTGTFSDAASGGVGGAAGAFGAAFGGGRGASPFAAIGGAGGSLFSGLLGGGSSGESSPLGMLGKLFNLGSGSGGGGGGSSGGGAAHGATPPAAVQPPTVTMPRPVTSTPVSGVDAATQAPDPVMTLTAPSSVRRGTAFAISWAALNVQSSTCVVKEGAIERGRGSLGSYTSTAPSDASITSIKFTFSCFSLGAKGTKVEERIKTVTLTQ